MRYELTDFEWAVIKPMLANTPRGVPRVKLGQGGRYERARPRHHSVTVNVIMLDIRPHFSYKPPISLIDGRIRMRS